MGCVASRAFASHVVETPPVPTESFSKDFSNVGIMPKTPIDPVTVTGSATILSAANDTQ